MLDLKILTKRQQPAQKNQKSQLGSAGYSWNGCDQYKSVSTHRPLPHWIKSILKSLCGAERLKTDRAVGSTACWKISISGADVGGKTKGRDGKGWSKSPGVSLAASVPTCSDWRLKFNTSHSHGSVVFVLSSFFWVIFLTLVSTLRIKKPMLTWLRGDFFRRSAHNCLQRR